MITVVLQKDKDRPIRMGHPWVFSGAIGKLTGEGADGHLCRVLAANGEVLGTGSYNKHSTIRVRMFTHGKDEFDETVLSQRIAAAAAMRSPILTAETDSCRLVNSEGDCLPGLIIDRYATGACMQILTAGMELFRGAIIEAVKKTCNPQFIYERSDTDARLREGLSGTQGLVFGELPQGLEIRENGLRFGVDLADGQKTGMFLDQRENRSLLRRYAEGKTMCDCFCYSGGFSVYALSAGAKHSTLVDISEDAVIMAKTNCEHNGFSADRFTPETSDVFTFLRKADSAFDCIVLDPPKFAKHRGEVSAAARGYKDINLLACKKIRPGGIVFTFSCSNAVDPYLFRQIVFAAAADSQRHVQVLHTLCAAPDHPFSVSHREGEYLKGLVLRVL